jgi:hypothetical protein
VVGVVALQHVIFHASDFSWGGSFADKHPTDYIQPIDSLTINPGDTVRMSVWAFTTTTGQILVENLSSNTKFEQQVSVPAGEGYDLCMQSAEWIVEDVGFGSGLAPFPNYGQVTFTDVYTNFGHVPERQHAVAVLNPQRRRRELHLRLSQASRESLAGTSRSGCSGCSGCGRLGGGRVAWHRSGFNVEELE